MTLTQIILIFEDMFPNTAKNVIDYKPQNGMRNSIHMVMTDGRHLVFTFTNNHDWSFETYGHFKVEHQDISFDFKY